MHTIIDFGIFYGHHMLR